MTKRLNLAVDLYGCPNRCTHCWLGHVPHRAMEIGADEWIAAYFRPYFEEIAFYSWFREPDNTPDYAARWERDKQLSVNAVPERFELASFYRLSRDPGYAEFLKSVGVKKVQLTVFGMEAMTDRYVGRRGAFRELMTASELLEKHGIATRYQAFIDMENREDVVKFRQWVGKPAEIFVHEGSCDGENRKRYDIRITRDAIPAELWDVYLGYDRITTEWECCEQLCGDVTSFVPHNEDEIVLNVTSGYDVYYNFTNLSENWKIGNMKTESPRELVGKIVKEDTFALQRAREISVKELVERYGDFTSERVFSPEDYKWYLLNNYIEGINP